MMTTVELNWLPYSTDAEGFYIEGGSFGIEHIGDEWAVVKFAPTGETFERRREATEAEARFCAEQYQKMDYERQDSVSYWLQPIMGNYAPSNQWKYQCRQRGLTDFYFNEAGDIAAVRPGYESELEGVWVLAKLHSVTNAAKMEKIAASIAANGWQGRPVLVVEVADMFQALTGSHRLAAAESAELEMVPCVVVNRELLDEAGYEVGELNDTETIASILSEIGDNEAAQLAQEEADHEINEYANV